MPEVIIHTAALTDVDRCEEDKELAARINCRGTMWLKEASAIAGSFLIYVSTDYVFDGKKGMYKETDATSPLSSYGRTKLAAERYADSVARPCVIYGARTDAGKLDFANWVISRLREGRTVKAVTDQHITPTYNSNLSRMLLEVASRRLSGTYHLSGSTRISRYDFACMIAERLSLDASLIEKSVMADLGWKAARPCDSSLDTTKASAALKEKPAGLKRSLDMLLEEQGGFS
jgi:dTDP-4-dehydrorhamnose reductase